MSNKKQVFIYVSATLVTFLICIVIAAIIHSKRETFSGQENNNLNEEKKKPNKKKKMNLRLSKPKKLKIRKIMGDEKINKIIESLNNTEDDEKKEELLDELFNTAHPKILDVVESELDNKNKDIRLKALELLSDFDGEEIFNNLNKALDDDSYEVRELAIELLDNVEIEGGSDNEAEIIARGVSDKSKDVRDMALSVLSDKPRNELEYVAENAISSPHTEVKEEILSELTLQPTMRGTEIMIKGMLDKDPDFREQVVHELEMITDQEFYSYKQAKEWLLKNRSFFEQQ